MLRRAEELIGGLDSFLLRFYGKAMKERGENAIFIVTGGWRVRRGG